MQKGHKDSLAMWLIIVKFYGNSKREPEKKSTRAQLASPPSALPCPMVCAVDSVWISVQPPLCFWVVSPIAESHFTAATPDILIPCLLRLHRASSMFSYGPPCPVQLQKGRVFIFFLFSVVPSLPGTVLAAGTFSINKCWMEPASAILFSSRSYFWIHMVI